MVAHSPRLVPVPGADGTKYDKRITTNDAWKVYAGASGKGKDNDYFFHHAALNNIVQHYVEQRLKQRQSPLTRIILWTDGCPGQYMCKENFVMVAQFWNTKGIELVHRFVSSSVFVSFLVSFLAPRPWSLLVAWSQRGRHLRARQLLRG